MKSWYENGYDFRAIKKVERTLVVNFIGSIALAIVNLFGLGILNTVLYGIASTAFFCALITTTACFAILCSEDARYKPRKPLFTSEVKAKKPPLYQLGYMLVIGSYLEIAALVYAVLWYDLRPAVIIGVLVIISPFLAVMWEGTKEFLRYFRGILPFFKKATPANDNLR